MIVMEIKDDDDDCDGLVSLKSQVALRSKLPVVDADAMIVLVSVAMRICNW